MKLTWFGGTTLRIHLGGAIVVVDGASVPEGVDRAELVSGADRVIEQGGADLPTVDGSTWRTRRLPRVLDAGDTLPPVEAWSMGEATILIEAAGEAPLLLAGGDVPTLGRWVDQAVVVLFGNAEQLTRSGLQLLDQAPPRLLALAGDESAIDDALPALRDRLDGTGLMALEAGLAVEI